MGDKTDINWTDATWNPIVGCSVVSPACTNCYAMAQAARIQRMNPGTHYDGTTNSVNGKDVWTGEINLAPLRTLRLPLSWSRLRCIFVNSMSDLFHDGASAETIARIYAVMIVAHHWRGHVFQWLTKRPARAREMLNDPAFWVKVEDRTAELIGTLTFGKRDTKAASEFAAALCKKIGDIGVKTPPHGIWAGVTTEDQERAAERIPALLATPAWRRFISAEPLLGEINLEAINFWSPCNIPEFGGEGDELLPALRPASRQGRGPGIDLVIAGGESGPRARSTPAALFRSLRDQCARAGVAYDLKQWGEWIDADEWLAQTSPARATQPLNYQEAARLAIDYGARSTHHSDGSTSIRVGKTRAGRHLDGKEHNGSSIFNGE